MTSNPILRGLARIIFWTYPRGSWQYDILCALILAFIFLTPPSVFEGEFFAGEEARPSSPPVEEAASQEVRHAPATEVRDGIVGPTLRLDPASGE